MNNLTIFVCTHTDFQMPVTAPFYKILDSRKLNDDVTKEGLPGSYYSELHNYRYAAENMELPDYVGFCGYRKYFRFAGNVSEDAIIKYVDKRGCITGELADFGLMTVREHYAFNHNKEDLELLECTVHDVAPEFIPAFTKSLNGHQMYTCNMFVMKRQDFLELNRFIFSIMDAFTERLLSSCTSVNDHVEEAFQKGLLRFGSVQHQSRIGGYLGERLVSAYIMAKFPDAYSAGMIMTGERIR